jgi:hypothetical protein
MTIQQLRNLVRMPRHEFALLVGISNERQIRIELRGQSRYTSEEMEHAHRSVKAHLLKLADKLNLPD